MSLVFFQPNRLGSIEFNNFTIDASADESLAFQPFKYVAEFAALILHQRREHNDFAVRFVGEDLIDNLLRRLSMDRFARGRIVGLADRRKKNPQIIINLGRSRDC